MPFLRLAVAASPVLLLACYDLDGIDDLEEVSRLEPQHLASAERTSDYPAVAKILTHPIAGSAAKGSTTCTATLVDCDKIATAAHCLCHDADKGLTGNCVTAIERQGVFLQHAGHFEIADIALHPDIGLVNGAPVRDIAVLTLARPVNGISPVPIQQSQPAFGSVTILGYGRTGPNTFDQGLKRVGSATTSSCAAPMNNTEHICFPSSSTGAVCLHDSGGPTLVGSGNDVRLAGVHAATQGALCDGIHIDTNVATSASFVLSHAPGAGGQRACGDLPQVGGGDTVVVSVEEEASSSVKLYTIDVPVGTTVFRVALETTHSSTAVLHLRRGAPPTSFLHDCAVTDSGTNAFCEIVAPEAGTWHIAASAFNGFHLTATVFGDGPIGEPDSYRTPRATQLEVGAADGVLANDGATSRGPLRAILVGGPAHGEVDLHEDGSFRYQPQRTYAGLDSFSYRATDGSYESAETVVDIEVEDADSGGPDSPDPDEDPDPSPAGGCAVAGDSPPAGALLLLAAVLLLRRPRHRAGRKDDGSAAGQGAVGRLRAAAHA